MAVCGCNTAGCVCVLLRGPAAGCRRLHRHMTSLCVVSGPTLMRCAPLIDHRQAGRQAQEEPCRPRTGWHWCVAPLRAPPSSLALVRQRALAACAVRSAPVHRFVFTGVPLAFLHRAPPATCCCLRRARRRVAAGRCVGRADAPGQAEKRAELLGRRAPIHEDEEARLEGLAGCV